MNFTAHVIFVAALPKCWELSDEPDYWVEVSSKLNEFIWKRHVVEGRDTLFVTPYYGTLVDLLDPSSYPNPPEGDELLEYLHVEHVEVFHIDLPVTPSKVMG